MHRTLPSVSLFASLGFGSNVLLSPSLRARNMHKTCLSRVLRFSYAVSRLPFKGDAKLPFERFIQKFRPSKPLDKREEWIE
jgi:hypothetical protein